MATMATMATTATMAKMIRNYDGGGEGGDDAAGDHNDGGYAAATSVKDSQRQEERPGRWKSCYAGSLQKERPETLYQQGGPDERQCCCFQDIFFLEIEIEREKLKLRKLKTPRNRQICVAPVAALWVVRRRTRRTAALWTDFFVANSDVLSAGHATTNMRSPPTNLAATNTPPLVACHTRAHCFDDDACVHVDRYCRRCRHEQLALPSSLSHIVSAAHTPSALSSPPYFPFRHGERAAGAQHG